MTPRRASGVIALGALGFAATAMALAMTRAPDPPAPIPATTRPPPPTDLGVNLFALETSNRQQVFANLVAQSQWFTDTGKGWTYMPDDALAPGGWVTRLAPGQVAPRPLVLPPPPFSTIAVRCTYQGRGALSAGGIAQVRGTGDGTLDLELVSSGAADEGAWIQLDRTDPADPVRHVDCRDRAAPMAEIFAPEFLASLRGFRAVRFLDWQLTNLNRSIAWDARTLPDHDTQVMRDGVAVETMVALANQAKVDPWFMMPYNADATYVRGFAERVHALLAPDRTVYVELGNEMWNTMFDATQQAEREGVAAKLSDDPGIARSLRYAHKARDAMRIWTAAFADRPARLVRVLGAQNVEPTHARLILDDAQMARWFDALATAPYIHADLDGRGVGDVDRIFAALPAAIDATIGFAAQNRALAASRGKRYIAYEGGQHLVTRDLDLARRLQRNPRMATVYARYLDAWRTRIGDRMMLYASTAPIAEFGSWGLREYAGQPERDAPKLRAVRAFLASPR